MWHIYTTGHHAATEVRELELHVSKWKTGSLEVVFYRK